MNWLGMTIIIIIKLLSDQVCDFVFGSSPALVRIDGMEGNGCRGGEREIGRAHV